jgi:hypothetical protein
VTWVPGHVAFQVEGTTGTFQGLSIYERDDAPLL